MFQLMPAYCSKLIKIVKWWKRQSMKNCTN